jgi:hemerythrin superfamily protein
MADHDLIDRLLDSLGQMESQDKRYHEKMTELIRVLSSHFESEEQEVFEEARKNLPEHRLEELGLEMEERRRLVTQMAA